MSNKKVFPLILALFLHGKSNPTWNSSRKIHLATHLLIFLSFYQCVLIVMQWIKEGGTLWSSPSSDLVGRSKAIFSPLQMILEIVNLCQLSISIYLDSCWTGQNEDHRIRWSQVYSQCVHVPGRALGGRQDSGTSSFSHGTLPGFAFYIWNLDSKLSLLLIWHPTRLLYWFET